MGIQEYLTTRIYPMDRTNFMKTMKMNQTLADAKKKLASTLITEPNRRDYTDEKVSLDFEVEQTLGQA